MRELSRHCGWTPREFFEGQSFAQFFVLWCKAPNVSTGLDMDALRRQINKRRKELGKPPMKPAGSPSHVS